MAKKKKKKGEKKKKGGKGAGTKKKRTQPTEKELFEMQVEELRRSLEASVVRLSELGADLDASRELLGKEVSSEGSCVAHLQDVLRRESERCRVVQERLQTECDLAELVERRALGKMAASGRSEEAARSHFLQQKAELEGKLSLLEELRLERCSQGAHLRRAEAALEERASALRARGREEDSNQADGLLRNREAFLRMCGEVRAEFRSAFELRLPVHAESQLREDVRLRAECGRAVDSLLEEQGRSRQLKAGRRMAELEEEVQESAEECTAVRMDRQEARIRRLMQAQRDLLSKGGSLGQGGMSRRPGDISANDGAVVCRTECIFSREAERCRLSDRWKELTGLLEDQERYRTSLEGQMEEAADRNGAMMSGLLRAGKVLRNRTGKVTPGSDPDYEVLLQIRLLLDLEETGGESE